MQRLFQHLSITLLLAWAGSAALASDAEADKTAANPAAENYQKYCALCHGADRQGHVNDHAPSLRSRSLIESGFPYHIYYAAAYGRRGTPMGGYLDEVGGPLNEAELFAMVSWLREMAGVVPKPVKMESISGDTALGKSVYARECASCHGADGEGGLGTALGNPVMLSLTTDAFLKYAVEHGRDGTDMPAFGGKLTPGEIAGVTAFLRSRATGWSVEKPVFRQPPGRDEYILNPEAEAPGFELLHGAYVTAKDLNEALQDKRRMVLLDTRVNSLWQMAHIEGAVPVPYYYDDLETLAGDLPADGTWIVAYCECPRAAAETVVQNLSLYDFENTAVLWEGIQGWVSLGYPVSRGESTPVSAVDLQ